MTLIDPRLVAVALATVETYAFEKFGQAFYGAIQDREFVPLGGMHDGGAEGFDAPEIVEPEVFEEEGASAFLQVSKEATVRQKIRKTVKRLREYGRKPTTVTFITSRLVQDIDAEERKLSEELNCRIRIRDASFIENNINAEPAIQAAFRAYLEPAIGYLFKPGAAEVATKAGDHTDRTLAVFLRQEVDNRRDRTGLLEAVADSLILWSLSDTDPVQGIFLKRAEILEKIEAALPASKQFIRGVLDDRLEHLTVKDAVDGRQIRHYRRENKYCLPYETRLLVAAENAEDNTLKAAVSTIFEDRIRSAGEDGIDNLQPFVVAACHATLERVFEHQGLEVAQFVTNGAKDDELYTDVEKIVSSVVDKLDVSGEVKGQVRRLSLIVLRGTFYRSTEQEREYLRKLSRTYVLLLMLKNEPRIVEYFRSIASSFRLYVGTDLIVRALSEQFLSVPNRMTVNLLSILTEAGAELILTEKTVEEVSTHLRRQIFEFENHYEPVESKIPVDMVEYIDRILIRAYFYAKLAPAEGVAPPTTWRAYISQFATYNDVRANRAATELAGYLVRKFRMTYETLEQMMRGIDQAELSELTKNIFDAKCQGGRQKPEQDVLAYNDALHVLRIYNKRAEQNEQSPGNKLGFQTWWLTQDSKVRRAGSAAAARRGGALFMMRPEFLLSYIGFAPELKEVRDSYDKIFPTVLGVRLSSRLAPRVFENVVADAVEVSAYDDARAGAMIMDLTNKLKGDALKRYDAEWRSEV